MSDSASEQPSGSASEQPSGSASDQPSGSASDQPSGSASDQPSVSAEPAGAEAEAVQPAQPAEPALEAELIPESRTTAFRLVNRQKIARESHWIKHLIEALLASEHEATSVLSIHMEDETPVEEYRLSLFLRIFTQYFVDEDGVQAQRSKNFIIKLLPTMEFIFPHLLPEVLFIRERRMYYLTLPCMYDTIDKYPQQNYTRWGPRCYRYERRASVVLQDLTELDYRMADCQKGLDLCHTRLVVKEIARFHATSLQLKFSEKGSIKSYSKDLFHYELVNAYHKFVERSFDNLLTVVSTWGEDMARLVPKIIKFSRIASTKAVNILSESPLFLNVLIHGDLRINNILFKYSDSDEPIALKFVDFQLCRVTTPVVDLLSLFYTSVDEEVFGSIDMLLKEYYHELITTCRVMNVFQEYSLHQLEEHYNNSRFYGLVAATTTLHQSRKPKLTENDPEFMDDPIQYPSYRLLMEKLLLHFRSIKVL